MYTDVMTDDKWQKLVEQAQMDFEDVLYYTDDILMEDRGDTFRDGTQDVLEFTNPRGKFKVIRINRLNMGPKIKFYKDSYGDWEELNAEHLGEIF